jgi:shikimate dehydrogenase
VRAGDLPAAVEALRRFDFRGANVTLPHKQAVLPLLDEISDLSRKMGAVNTIINENGKLVGTTTDAEGFLEGFREAGHDFGGRTVAILGNGGSARTLAHALMLAAPAPARVVLVARDRKKSERLAKEIPGLEITDLGDYASLKKDIQVVVNATPVGMLPDPEASPLRPEDLQTGQIIYDIVYTPERTRLLRDAQDRGLQTVGGLGMLVHQGRASFRLWTGVMPEASLFYQAARARLQDK